MNVNIVKASPYTMSTLMISGIPQMSSRTFSLSTQVAVFIWSAMAVSSALASTATDIPPPEGCDIIGSKMSSKSATPALTAVFPPTQLDIRTPLDPTVLAGNGRNYLIYELHFRNFEDRALTLRGIEIIDADNDKKQLLDELKGEPLKQRLRVAGADGQEGTPRLANGQSAVAFLCLAFDAKMAVPGKLLHRILLDGTTADSPLVGTRQTPLQVLGRPLAGSNWTADNGPSLNSHHRMGLFVAGGQAQISRRYAIDWKKYRNGESYSGDARDVHSYFAYGENVLAVASGMVVEARDGLPDNVPRTMNGFTPAIPITMDSIPGNYIVIDLGDKQFAQYAHLQSGSLRIKAGERVQRGQLLARVGNSGDARVPHLHFQVANNPTILASEGLPFLIDRYRLRLADDEWEQRTREFPMAEGVIDFGP